MNNNQNRTQTSTQIRNLYSDGMSYLNIKFYNTSLSFCLYPFLEKDNVGMSKYDLKSGQQTTVNFEGAYVLYQAAKDIIEGKIQEINQTIPCYGATITLERKTGANGKMETFFSITKNNVTILFKFPVVERQIKNAAGQMVTETVDAGLGAFMETIKGYLNGINADRHLDKLTEDFAKSQQPQQGGQQQGGYNNNNGYRNNNGYKKPYNGGGYKKPYNGGYNQQGGYNNNQPRQQDMSSYNIQN